MARTKKPKRYQRSHLPWTDMEKWRLRTLFLEGYPLDYISEELQRPAKTIVTMLVQWKLVVMSRDSTVYRKVPWADVNKFDPA